MYKFMFKKVFMKEPLPGIGENILKVKKKLWRRLRVVIIQSYKLKSGRIYPMAGFAPPSPI